MASMNVQLNISGMPEVIAQLRGELSAMLLAAAARETDLRVVERLKEVASAFAQSLSQVEAVERMKNPPEHTGLPHRAPAKLDAVGTAGGKATVETR